MGSIGDGGGIKPTEEEKYPNDDFAPFYAQPHDSQIPHSPLSGEKFGGGSNSRMVDCTMPFDDTVPVEDAFETQIVNLGDETQVLDEPEFGDDMETQLMDEFLNSDGEGNNGTEVLDVDDELSDGGSQRRGPVGEKIQHSSLCKHDKKGMSEQADALANEQHSAGLHVSAERSVIQDNSEPKPKSVPRFLTERINAMRAYALKVQNKTLKRTTGGSFSLPANSQFPERCSDESNVSKTKDCEEVDWTSDKGGCDNDLMGLRNGKKSDVGCSAVRKLFAEHSSVVNLRPIYDGDNNVRGGEEALQLPSCDDRLAGLSYVDSQEPGESSQANALACVQKLIDESKALFDDDVEHAKSSRAKASHISAAKGSQSLAMKANVKGINKKTMIFEWDDGLEDEGGGDIFRRRKEEFFGHGITGQRSFIKPKKTRSRPQCQNGDGQLSPQHKATFHSDSKVVLHKLKVDDKTSHDGEMTIRKNLINKFDEQSYIDKLEDTVARGDMPEMLEVGINTQMAAEAMEALFNGDGIADHGSHHAHLGQGNSSKESLKKCPRTKAKRSLRSKKSAFSDQCHVGVTTRQSKKMKIAVKSSKESSISAAKHTENVTDKFELAESFERGQHGELDMCYATASREGSSVKEQQFPQQVATSSPISHRTRRSLVNSHLKSAEFGKERAGTQCVKSSKQLKSKGKSSELELENLKPEIVIDCPRGRRSQQNLSGQRSEPDNLDVHSKSCGQQQGIGKLMSGHKRARSSARTTNGNLRIKKNTRSSTSAHLDVSSICQNSNGESSPESADKLASIDVALDGKVDMSGMKTLEGRRRVKAVKVSNEMSNADEMNVSSDKIPKEASKLSESACITPANCVTPVNAASPLCVGDGYFNQSCKKNLARSFLVREIDSTCATGPELLSSPKDTRKRRDLSSIRVLFSHHLDEDIIKQQRKIADRLKVSVATSITDATHFITDKFVRTRNMLEAIALGKPVVTHFWLENVGRTNYYIDEQKYILKDMKKEREIGFNMAVSLARARQHPLLQGRRILITPNAKPSRDIVSSLVKAVHGQAVERVGRSALKDDMVPNDLLILSCEEDYKVCLPFLEKGAAVYSSELLLCGIVTQRLEYERHQLFADHVKRTRSTTWLKREGRQFVPVKKH